MSERSISSTDAGCIYYRTTPDTPRFPVQISMDRPPSIRHGGSISAIRVVPKISMAVQFHTAPPHPLTTIELSYVLT